MGNSYRCPPGVLVRRNEGGGNGRLQHAHTTSPDIGRPRFLTLVNKSVSRSTPPAECRECCWGVETGGGRGVEFVYGLSDVVPEGTSGYRRRLPGGYQRNYERLSVQMLHFTHSSTIRSPGASEDKFIRMRPVDMDQHSADPLQECSRLLVRFSKINARPSKLKWGEGPLTNSDRRGLPRRDCY